MSRRGHVRRRVVVLLLPVLALTLAGPLPAHAVEPPPELSFVCVDRQGNVLFAAGPHECAGGEILRRLPDDRPLHWCADHLGRLSEADSPDACSARERSVTVPTDGPVHVCARNIQGGRTLSRGALRMVTDLSNCDRDETGLVTPAAPEAVADTYTVDEDSPLVVPDRGVLDNDRDLTGQPLTARLSSEPTTGNLELSSQGGFTYDPRGRFDHLDQGATAQVTFAYRADDGALRSPPATVTVTIRGRNDRPVAADDVVRVDEDGILELRAPGLLANDSDSEDHALTTELLDGPDKGSLDLRADGGLRFDARDDFQHLGAVEGETESTTFAYVARDGSTASDAATVRVQVHGVNDAPVGGADRVSTDENTPVEITASQLVSNDSDAENQPLSVTDIAPPQPGNGVITPLPGGGIRLDPNADSTDDDGAPDFDHLLRGQTAEVALTYRADDGSLRSDPVTVTITVHGLSAPTANDDVAATDEDHEVAIDVLGNDRVEDGELTVQTDGTGGRVTVEAGKVARYDPRGTFDSLADGATGVDSFRYTLTNDEGSSTGDVTVRLTGVNDAPVATDDTYEIEAGTPLDVPAFPADGPCPCGVLVNDTDVDTVHGGLTARLVSPPDRGRLTLEPRGGFTFDPAGEFDQTGGETSFTYRVDDGSDESAVATVQLSVDSNVPPEFDSETEDGPDTYSFTVPERDLGAWRGTVSATDPDGDDVGYAVVNEDTGAFAVDGSGKVRVTEALASGTYRFDIEATDGRGGRDVATVTLHVVPELEAVDDTFAGVGNTQVVGGQPTGTPYSAKAAVRVRDLLANDSGVSGTVAPATSDTALGGTVTIERDGSFVYAPPLLPASAWDGAAPQDRFSYTVEDERVDEADATGSVTITLAEPVWYVDADADTPGTGTAWAPYRSLDSVSGAADPDAPGQTIFLFGGADDPATPDVVERAVFGGGVVLEDQQRLVGHAAGLVVDKIDVAAAGPRPLVHGPEGGSAVSLASGNTVTGLDVGGVGNGVVGSGVGALTLHVTDIATDGSPLELAGGSVDLRIDEVTARGAGARAELTNLEGSTRIGTVSVEAPGSALGLIGNAGDVEVTEVVVGGGTLEVHGNASGANVHVRSLVGEDVALGTEIIGNRGTVRIEQLDLTEVRGTGVRVTDERGITSIGGGLISGASGTVTGALVKVGGDGSGTDGRVELGADLALQAAAADAGEPTGRALLITGVGEGGEVVVTGHLLDRGLGLRAVGVPGTVRLLGGADVRTSSTPALHVGDVDRLEIGGTVETVLSTIGGAPTLVMRQVGIAAAGARISELNSSDARTTAALIERVQAGPAGPGLTVVDGSVTTPGTQTGEDVAGVDIGSSSGVTVQGLLIRDSFGDGVTVESSSDVALDGVTVTGPERTGVSASRTDRLLIDATTVRNAGTHGIWLHDLQGLQRIRRSEIEGSGGVQLLVEDATASTAVQDTVVLESSVATGGAPEVDSIRVRATDDVSAPPADLTFRVSGDTASGSIGGAAGLSAVADKGAKLGLDLRAFAVAGTAGDAIRMAARDSGSVLDFALRELNGTGGGGLQFTGGAGIHAEGDGHASIGGTIAGVDVLNPDGHGLFLKQVAGVDVSTLNVQGGGLHGVDLVDSTRVNLQDVDVALPAEHGLRVVSSSDIQLDDSRFEQRTPAPAGQGDDSYPAFAAVWIRHLGGSENAITDTTLRGSIGHQLYIHNGPCAVDTCPTPSPDDWMTANVRISGITTVDTAVDPHPEPTDEVDPPPGDAVHVLASDGAEVGVDLRGASASHIDAPVRLLANAGGTLTVTGGHQIVHDGAGDSLALTAAGPDALLRMALTGLEISQIAPQDGAAPPKHGLLVTASGDGRVRPLHDDPDEAEPDGSCPPAERPTSVEDSAVRAVGAEPAVSFVAHGTEDPSTEAGTALEVDTSSLSATVDGDTGNAPAVEMRAEAQGTVEDSTLCGGVLTATAGGGDALLVQTVDGESTDDPSTPTTETTTRESFRGLEVIGTTVDSADGRGVAVVGSFRELTEVSNVVVRDVTVTRAGSLGMGFAYLEDLVVRGSRVRNAGSHGLRVTHVIGTTTLDGSGGAAGGTPGDPTDNAHVSSSGHGIWVDNSECVAVTDYTVDGVGVDADGDPRAAFNIAGGSLVDFRPPDVDPDDDTDHSGESVADWLERKGNGKPADAPWFTGTADPASCNPEGA